MSISIRCPNCGGRIGSEDVNLDRLVGRCRVCDDLFDCSEQLPASSGGGVAATPVPKRAEAACPSSIVSTPRGRDITFTRRWFSPQIFALLFFCVFWDGFLIVWYSLAFSAKNPPLAMLLFPLLHVAVGVLLSYTVITGFFNRSELKVDSMDFEVWHGPLPWPGGKKLRTNELKQFFVVQHIGNKGSRSYELCCLLANGDRVSILSGLHNVNEAYYLEQQLEKHLNIADEAVTGEFK
ncbi:MAG: hypothetical protein AB7S38_16280 [Vulcanimicrobiota bacterium]